MGMTEPTPNASANVWGSLINSCLDTIDSHDHTVGKGVKVPVSGLNLNADVSLSGLWAITAARGFDMTPVAASSVATLSSAIFTNSADNNLYFRNSSGTNVQLTAGNTLNISVAGAIGGDYGSVGALLDFIDANDTYHFYQQVGGGVRQYGRVAHADVDLFEYKANPSVGVPTNRVRLSSPAALAASYTLTWMAALPGTTNAVVMTTSSTGNIVTDVNAAVYAGDFRNNVVRVMSLPASIADLNANARLNDAFGRIGISLNGGTGSTGQSTFPIPLFEGDQVSQVDVFINKSTSNTSTISTTLRLFDLASASTSASNTVNNSANAPGALTLTHTSLGTAYKITSGKVLTVCIGMTVGAGTTDFCYGVRVSYTRP